MSVHVGIDEHRKRSQIAVLDEEGTVRGNRNVSNEVKSVPGVIGELPSATARRALTLRRSISAARAICRAAILSGHGLRSRLVIPPLKGG